MKTSLKILTLGLAYISAATLGNATPSTQIWIPSTDIQPFNVWHLGVDNYLRASDSGRFTPGERDPNITDVGLTVGVLPLEKLKAEVGVDYLVNGTAYDDNPLYFNAKIGIPEGALFTNSLSLNSPSLAVGGFNFGTNSKKSSATRTDQNIVYGEVGETLPAFGALPSLGRFSVGYYQGNGDVLLGKDGGSANSGILASWDRSMSEISDKLWVAIDYMGGDNFNSGLSLGASWAFSKNVSVILGYDMWDKPTLAGSNTLTVQLDINFP
ncbi:MAG: hypothetical protein WCO77_06840 [bacterium]